MSEVNLSKRIAVPVQDAEGRHLMWLTVQGLYGVSRVIMLTPLVRANNESLNDELPSIVSFAGTIMHISRQGDPPPPATSQSVLDLIIGVYTRRQKEEWKDKTDPLLSISYILLKDRLITRDEAFQIAQELLRNDAPVSADSWRVRVNEWAKKQEYDPVGQPRRRKRQKSGIDV